MQRERYDENTDFAQYMDQMLHFCKVQRQRYQDGDIEASELAGCETTASMAEPVEPAAVSAVDAVAAVPAKPKSPYGDECFYCKATGHFARECPRKKSGLPPGTNSVQALLAEAVGYEVNVVPDQDRRRKRVRFDQRGAPNRSDRRHQSGQKRFTRDDFQQRLAALARDFGQLSAIAADPAEGQEEDGPLLDDEDDEGTSFISAW